MKSISNAYMYNLNISSTTSLDDSQFKTTYYGGSDTSSGICQLPGDKNSFLSSPISVPFQDSLFRNIPPRIMDQLAEAGLLDDVTMDQNGKYEISFTKIILKIRKLRNKIRTKPSTTQPPKPKNEPCLGNDLVSKFYQNKIEAKQMVKLSIQELKNDITEIKKEIDVSLIKINNNTEMVPIIKLGSTHKFKISDILNVSKNKKIQKSDSVLPTSLATDFLKREGEAEERKNRLAYSAGIEDLPKKDLLKTLQINEDEYQQLITDNSLFAYKERRGAPILVNFTQKWQDTIYLDVPPSIIEKRKGKENIVNQEKRNLMTTQTQFNYLNKLLQFLLVNPNCRNDEKINETNKEIRHKKKESFNNGLILLGILDEQFKDVVKDDNTFHFERLNTIFRKVHDLEVGREDLDFRHTINGLLDLWSTTAFEDILNKLIISSIVLINDTAPLVKEWSKLRSAAFSLTITGRTLFELIQKGTTAAFSKEGWEDTIQFLFPDFDQLKAQGKLPELMNPHGTDTGKMLNKEEQGKLIRQFKVDVEEARFLTRLENTGGKILITNPLSRAGPTPTTQQLQVTIRPGETTGQAIERTLEENRRFSTRLSDTGGKIFITDPTDPGPTRPQIEVILKPGESSREAADRTLEEHRENNRFMTRHKDKGDEVFINQDGKNLRVPPLGTDETSADVIPKVIKDEDDRKSKVNQWKKIKSLVGTEEKKSEKRKRIDDIRNAEKSDAKHKKELEEVAPWVEETTDYFKKKLEEAESKRDETIKKIKELQKEQQRREAEEQQRREAAEAAENAKREEEIERSRYEKARQEAEEQTKKTWDQQQSKREEEKRREEKRREKREVEQEAEEQQRRDEQEEWGFATKAAEGEKTVDDGTFDGIIDLDKEDQQKADTQRLFNEGLMAPPQFLKSFGEPQELFLQDPEKCKKEFESVMKETPIQMLNNDNTRKKFLSEPQDSSVIRPDVRGISEDTLNKLADGIIRDPNLQGLPKKVVEGLVEDRLFDGFYLLKDAGDPRQLILTNDPILSGIGKDKFTDVRNIDDIGLHNLWRTAQWEVDQGLTSKSNDDVMDFKDNIIEAVVTEVNGPEQLGNFLVDDKRPSDQRRSGLRIPNTRIGHTGDLLAQDFQTHEEFMEAKDRRQQAHFLAMVGAHLVLSGVPELHGPTSSAGVGVDTGTGSGKGVLRDLVNNAMRKNNLKHVDGVWKPIAKKVARDVIAGLGGPSFHDPVGGGSGKIIDYSKIDYYLRKYKNSKSVAKKKYYYKKAKKKFYELV